MRRFVVGIVGFAALAVSADAALVCASQPEMKVLQSAALQQQLMVAALSCHLSADYNAFVAAYRGRLVQSDQALKAFFASRPRGEDYNAYKTRIANTVSLRSLRDGRFCDSAHKVFDMALGRSPERNGLAPEPPQLIDTGYEGCRPVDDSKLIEAKVIPRPTPRPQTKIAVIPKPAPAKPASAPVRVASLQLAKPAAIPKPVVTPEAAHALALADHPKAAKAAAVAPPLPVATPAPRVTTRVATIVRPAKVRSMPRTASRVSADEDPSLYPQPSHATADEDPSRYPPSRVSADEDPSRYPQPTHATADEDPSRYPPSRVSADEDPSLYPQPSHATADEDQLADDRIPNAYRPGAQWVRDPGPTWHPVDYGPPPPRWHHPRSRADMVRTPDGHWVVVIGQGPRWRRD